MNCSEMENWRNLLKSNQLSKGFFVARKEFSSWHNAVKRLSSRIELMKKATMTKTAAAVETEAAEAVEDDDNDDEGCRRRRRR